MMNKKVAVIYAVSMLLVFSITFASSYYLFTPGSMKHGYASPSVNLYLTMETGMGIYDVPIGNVITDIGENQTRTRMSTADTYVATKYISLSNDASADASWTKLPNEATTAGAGRATGDVVEWTNSGDAAFNVTATFNFSGDITLKAIGLHWSATPESDNNLFACANFAETAFANNWNMTATWVVTFDAN